MGNHSLLTRDQFREQVLARKNGQCCFCGEKAVDAHHIVERKLWGDGGYYLANGAQVCADHHMACETTEISTEEVRKACGITDVLLPAHFEVGSYDKWGNPVLPNGQRLRGEMFYEEQVQKVLKDKLHLFTSWVKYPRTYHLPWSPGCTSDDKVLSSLAQFEGKNVVQTIKMDGENTTMYSNYIHARSLDGRHHDSRNWVKQFHAGLAQDIPEGWRVCGENLFARHSIGYENLPSYFLGFSIWNERNRCLPWAETLEWFELLGITPVETIYQGVWDPEAIKAAWQGRTGQEGYVVRLADGFGYSEFRQSVAKFVRANHVQTDQHWMQGTITKNGIV